MTNRIMNIGSIVAIRLIPAYDISVPNFETVNLSQLDIPPGKSFKLIPMADDTAPYECKPRDTPNGTLYDISLSFATNGVIDANRRAYSSKVVAWITDAHGTNILLPAAKVLWGEGIGKTAKSENVVTASLTVTSENQPVFMINDGYATPPVEVDDFIINKDNGLLTFETFEPEFQIIIRLRRFWPADGTFYMNQPDGSVISMVIPAIFGLTSEFQFTYTNVPQGFVFKIWNSELIGTNGFPSEIWNSLPYTFIDKIVLQNAGIKRFEMQWDRRNFEKVCFRELDLSGNALQPDMVNRIIERYAIGQLSWNGDMTGWRHDIKLNGGTNAAPSGSAIDYGIDVNTRYPEPLVVIAHNGSPWT